jgi:hypothetical protein
MTPHKHAELMAEYAKDAMETDKPWERWEQRHECNGFWSQATNHPLWEDTFFYRRKPKSSKARFEAYMREERCLDAFGLSRNRDDGSYTIGATQKDWLLWQEAERQALGLAGGGE